MKIMVFDVAAEYGGALSILDEYYKKAIKENNKNIQWIFILSKPNYKETDNVKILRFPWIKKSWFHRLFFDFFVAPKLIKKFNIDEILSLQNVLVKNKKRIKQTVYIHQSLPFVEYKFKLRENSLFWVYQNIIGKLIINSIKKADRIIVQTKWMKEACQLKAQEPSFKFTISPPEINIDVKKTFEINQDSTNSFFYPAGSGYYKNHRIIVESCKILINEGINNFKVFLTLNGDENKHIISLKEEVLKLNLPIFFIGQISRESVFEYYSKSILIFPSYIESSPLPLIEGKMHKTIILASDCPFSKEILNDYNLAYYFQWDKPIEMADLMKEWIFKE